MLGGLSISRSPFRRLASTPNASDIAARLVAEVRNESNATVSANVADALSAVSDNLCRYLGTTGCHALMSRALRDASRQHPSLADLAITADPPISVSGIPGSVSEHGDFETASGLQHLLEAVIELLGRLIGEQLALTLLERPNG